ncbi:endonuclease domain-containing protein [Dactylosporangium sp. CA-139066]|uniref:endonuclease domain-containing protein n=1 Tax=Dactylosporangium sp. CA-139066 TaxID=3239930 RepID=UPI003D8A33B4
MSAESLAMLAEPLPPDAPAIVTYGAVPRHRTADVIATMLVELDRVARELYPSWLPQAADIDGPAGAGLVAVRSLALEAAERTGQYGPFLADLAERSLLERTVPNGVAGSFDAEVRATGLARVIATAFGRARTAILVRVEESLDAEQQLALVAAGRWLSDSGRFGIWFAGDTPHPIDAVEIVRFAPPAGSAMLSVDRGVVAGPAPRPVMGYPAIAGRPHPGSRAEKLLEASLEPAAWAAGRAWNQTYQSHPLMNPIRVDLLWQSERLVVEIDGAEHCQPERFAADRQRDVQLQLDGYAVLRFTNHQVLAHRELVLAQIQQFLAGRRAGTHKGALHAGH